MGYVICAKSLYLYVISITRCSKGFSDASNSLDARGILPFDYWFKIPEHWYDFFKAKRTAFRNNLLNSPRYAKFEAKESRVYGFFYSFCTFEFIPRIAQKRYERFCTRFLQNMPDEKELSAEHFELA